MPELRQYQIEGIKRLASKAAEGKRRLLFQLATGGGKTVAFAGLCQRFLQKQQKKVLILVHREELLKQAYKTLFEWYKIAAAPVTAGNDYLPNVMVYIAMVETAYNRLRRNVNYFSGVGLVIVDECHIGNFKKLYDFFPDSLIIGFTATPVSSSKKDPLKNYFQDIVCGIDIPDLIATGSLVPNKTYHLKNVDRGDLKMKNGEFDEAEMGKVFGSMRHVQNTISAYEKFGRGTKTIIFNCNIEHSKKVTEAFLSAGYNCRHLDGEASEKERKAVLEWFRNTPDAVLNNIGVLTTGFDEPSVQTVIVNKSTMSLPLWLQVTGRGSRPFPGKEYFTIVDMGGNAMYHGDWCEPRDWADMFHNPDKPKEGGEAPVKECIGCGVLIHIQQKQCPHCGAINHKAPEYDKEIVAFELLRRDRPLQISVSDLVKSCQGIRREYYVPHLIKDRIIQHAAHEWRIKRLDNKTAEKLLNIYFEKVKEWCCIMEKSYNTWHRERAREWFNEALGKTFKWEEKAKATV